MSLDPSFTFYQNHVIECNQYLDITGQRWQKTHLRQSLGPYIKKMTPGTNMEIENVERAYSWGQNIKKLGWGFASFFCNDFLKNYCFMAFLSVILL